eukprot:157974-Hanusia_phi.AAC.2
MRQRLVTVMQMMTKKMKDCDVVAEIKQVLPLPVMHVSTHTCSRSSHVSLPSSRPPLALSRPPLALSRLAKLAASSRLSLLSRLYESL